MITIVQPDISNEENEKRWEYLNNLIWEILERQNIEKPA
jgi:hypothetical protein